MPGFVWIVAVGGLLTSAQPPERVPDHLWPLYPLEGRGAATCMVGVRSTQSEVDLVEVEGCDPPFADAAQEAASRWPYMVGPTRPRDQSMNPSWVQVDGTEPEVYARFRIRFRADGTVVLRAADVVQLRRSQEMLAYEDWICTAQFQVNEKGRPTEVQVDGNCPTVHPQYWRWNPLVVDGQPTPFTVTLTLAGAEDLDGFDDLMDTLDWPFPHPPSWPD